MSVSGHLTDGPTSHIITRRQFVSGALAAVAPLTLRIALPPRLLRIATVVDPARAGLDAGLAFGASEADRSASLFGWHVERVDVRPSDVASCDFSGVSAVVVGSDVAMPGAPVVLIATCRADAAGFRLIPDALCTQPASNGARLELWHSSLQAFGAEQLNNRYRAVQHTDMTSGAWVGWFSMKLITEAAMRARTTSPSELAAYLRSPAAQFDGHKGAPLRFAHDALQQPIYHLSRGADGAWAVDQVVAPAAP